MCDPVMGDIGPGLYVPKVRVLFLLSFSQQDIELKLIFFRSKHDINFFFLSANMMMINKFVPVYSPVVK